ncbi:MAG: DUF1846 family protein, partial [Coriobacteriales bacterium]|nr:DUF1846 family protein [Coriobacteriales bacterium]
CIEKEETTGVPCAAITLSDGSVVTGKTSDLLGCASSCLMNALKTLAKIDDDIHVITDEAIHPICDLKTNVLGSKNPRLHSDETLIALSISSSTDKLAQKAMEQLKNLRGCDAHLSVIPAAVDELTFKKLGMNLSYEPKYETISYFHK